jgi:hypothetical protein
MPTLALLPALSTAAVGGQDSEPPAAAGICVETPSARDRFWPSMTVALASPFPRDRFSRSTPASRKPPS